MGAWGAGPFDNDDASDFAGDLSDIGDPAVAAAVLGDALLAVTAADDYIESPEMTIGLAAACIVAVLAGAPHDDAWPIARTWFDGVGRTASAELRDHATTVFDRAFVPEDNEWYELWDEAGEVAVVQQRLAPFRAALG